MYKLKFNYSYGHDIVYLILTYLQLFYKRNIDGQFPMVVLGRQKFGGCRSMI